MPIHGAKLCTEVRALVFQEVTWETLTVQWSHCWHTGEKNWSEMFSIGNKYNKPRISSAWQNWFQSQNLPKCQCLILCLMQTIFRWLSGLVICELGRADRMENLPKAGLGFQTQAVLQGNFVSRTRRKASLTSDLSTEVCARRRGCAHALQIVRLKPTNSIFI